MLAAVQEIRLRVGAMSNVASAPVASESQCKNEDLQIALAPIGGGTPANRSPLVLKAPEDPPARFVNRIVAMDLNNDGKLSTDEFVPYQRELRQLRQGNKHARQIHHLLCRAAEDFPLVCRYELNGSDLSLIIPTPDGHERLFEAAHCDNVASTKIPERLVTANGSVVRHSEDPGDFYCEHMFFFAQLEASRPGNCILQNRYSEPLVGFIHCPGDDYISEPAHDGYENSERHGGTQEVVGAAINGYVMEAMEQKPNGPLRIMLTGFEEFFSVRNNPTEEFVRRRENIDASMEKAFGDLLVKHQSGAACVYQRTRRGLEGVQFWYHVRDPKTGQIRTVEIYSRSYPVTDNTINPSHSSSVQSHLRVFRPHAVISLGLDSSTSEWWVEHRADANGLLRTPTAVTHDDGGDGVVRLRDNYSLARAMSTSLKGDR